VAARLPVDRPRYLMGVGRPIDLLEAVHRGVDLFDCILPTALAQQGVAFTAAGQGSSCAARRTTPTTARSIRRAAARRARGCRARTCTT
jgi:tRNA-guanine family transglycosylase